MLRIVLSPQVQHGGADLSLLTRTRWYDQRFQGWKADLTPRWCHQLCQTASNAPR